MTIELVASIVFAARHCERSEAISTFRRFEIAAACFAGLAMTTYKIKCHGAVVTKPEHYEVTLSDIPGETR